MIHAGVSLSIPGMLLTDVRVDLPRERYAELDFYLPFTLDWSDWRYFLYHRFWEPKYVWVRLLGFGVLVDLRE